MPEGDDFRTASFLGKWMGRGALEPTIFGLFVLVSVDSNARHLGHYLMRSTITTNPSLTP